MKEILKYPIFAFGQKNDFMIYVFYEEKRLKSTNVEFLKNRMFDNTQIIDSNGCVYIIKNAYFIKYLYCYGFNIFLKGRQILVDFEFEEKKEIIELVDFKKKIIPMIEKMRHFWEESYSMKDLKKMIENSDSFEQIAKLLH